MKKIIFILILSMVLIFGCKTEQKELTNNIFDDKTTINVTESSAQEKKEITLQSLEDTFRRLLPKNEIRFIQDENYHLYYKGNGQRFYVVYMPKEEINDAKTLYNKISAENGWEDYGPFLNATTLRWLHPPLTEKNYTSEKQYRDYIQNRVLVNRTTLEKTINLEDGKVLEYQFFNWMYDAYNQFQGSWEPTLLLYKIYCTPKMIVFIRPGFEDMAWAVSGQKINDTFRNWDLTVERVRPEMLKMAEEIMKSCNVKKEFFDDMPKEDFMSTETLAYYYKTDLTFYWNLTTDISTEIKKVLTSENKYKLTVLNVTFGNYEGSDIDYGPLLLDITTAADEGDERVYVSNKKMGDVFKDNKIISRSFEIEDDPVFYNNLTINIKMYTDDNSIPIRPKTIIIDTNNKVIG